MEPIQLPFRYFSVIGRLLGSYSPDVGSQLDLPEKVDSGVVSSECNDEGVVWKSYHCFCNDDRCVRDFALFKCGVVGHATREANQSIIC